MKLPRWLVGFMLSACAIAALSAGAWWWHTWPERTAREFVRRLTYDDDSWTEMFPPEIDVESNWARLVRVRLFISVAPKDWSEVSVEPHDLVDEVLGRRRYRTSSELGWEFTTCRGSVIPSADDDTYKKGTLLLYRIQMEELMRQNEKHRKALEDLQRRETDLRKNVLDQITQGR